jgi:hypothetical protein
MLAKTETSYAPWTVVEANDQRWALIRIFEVLAQRMQHELDRRSEKKPVSNQATEMIDELHREKPKKRSKRASGVNGHHDEQPQETEVTNA